jgi:hypothetical protein
MSPITVTTVTSFTISGNDYSITNTNTINVLTPPTTPVPSTPPPQHLEGDSLGIFTPPRQSSPSVRCSTSPEVEVVHPVPPPQNSRRTLQGLVKQAKEEAKKKEEDKKEKMRKRWRDQKRKDRAGGKDKAKAANNSVMQGGRERAEERRRKGIKQVIRG